MNEKLTTDEQMNSVFEQSDKEFTAMYKKQDALASEERRKPWAGMTKQEALAKLYQDTKRRLGFQDTEVVYNRIRLAWGPPALSSPYFNDYMKIIKAMHVIESMHADS